MDRGKVTIIAVKFHVQCQHSRVNSSNRREVYIVFLCVLGGLPLCKHFTYSVGAAVRWDHMSTNGTPF